MVIGEVVLSNDPKLGLESSAEQGKDGSILRSRISKFGVSMESHEYTNITTILKHVAYLRNLPSD